MMRWLAGLTLLWAISCHAFCFQAAGARYRVDPLLLESIAIHESGMNPYATGINRNTAGHITSLDYGVMQINSTHIPELRQLGLIHSPQDLLNDACLNVQVGAWVLARTLRLCGVSWECLGAYNAGFLARSHENRQAYARHIYAIYRCLRAVPPAPLPFTSLCTPSIR
jgi:soluble lytic murein transglycosylase-like protein